MGDSISPPELSQEENTRSREPPLDIIEHREHAAQGLGFGADTCARWRREGQ